MSETLVVEIAPFSLKPGVSESDLLGASERLENEFFSCADGYLGRILVRAADQSWADIVFWQSAAHADAAMSQAEKSEACGHYFACMAGADLQPGQGVSMLTAVKRYEPKVPSDSSLWAATIEGKKHSG
jgi:hypothetical protein